MAAVVLNGAANVRYAQGKKGKMVKLFKHMLGEHLYHTATSVTFSDAMPRAS